MRREIQQWLQWVKLYETSGDVGFVCRRCGISRPTLRKWWRRYLAQGIAGLESHSRRPKRSPSTKTDTCEVALILELRSLRNLGARRIQSELKRLHSISLAMATIHKVLRLNLLLNSGVKLISFATNVLFPMIGFRWIPVKLAPASSIDDCTRYRVLRLYSRRTATNILDFIELLLKKCLSRFSAFRQTGEESFLPLRCRKN